MFFCVVSAVPGWVTFMPGVWFTRVPLSHNFSCEETSPVIGVPSSLYNLMPGVAGAKNRSLLHSYIVANVRRWFFAAENENDTDCPGSISGDAPEFLNVPDSTSGLLSNTFSIVIVFDCIAGSLSFLHDAMKTMEDITATVF